MNKEYKVIPRAGVVKGEMFSNWIIKDMRRGIKNARRELIVELLPAMIDSINGVLKAQAKCSPKDEFDERIGKLICEEKLEMKNHLQAARVYSRMFRLLSETAHECYKLCEMHQEKAQRIEKDLRETYGGRDE